MKILLFGDSNLWGYDPLSQDQLFLGKDPISQKTLYGGYGAFLKQWHPEWQVIINGQNGRLLFTGDPFFGDLDGSKQITRFLWKNAPYDLIVIGLGSNDARAMFCRSLESWKDSLVHFCDKLNKTNQEIAQSFHRQAAPILFLQPPFLAKSSEVIDGEMLQISFKESGREILAKCGPVIQEMAQEIDADFLDNEGLTGGEIDGIHLTALQHQHYAKRIEKAILDSFKKS